MSWVMKRILPNCIKEETLLTQDKLTLLDNKLQLTVRQIVALYVRGRVILTINNNVRSHIWVALTWMIDVSIFQTHISPISSSKRLEVTSKVLEELE